MNASSSLDAAHEVVSSRRLPFSPEHVFAAFSDPTRLARWWGPNGFANRIDEFDLRPGGLWQLTMIAPDGTAFDNRSRFVVVAPPHRVEFVHEEPVHRFRMAMTFEPDGASTQLTWRMRFDDPAELARVREFIVPANEQNFDRLLAHLNAHA